MTNRYLPTALRRTLEKTVKGGRIIAEEGAGDAIQRLGVAAGKAPAYLNDGEKELRRRLRAHARALGDAFNKADETQETKRLVEAAAYAHWHRMLFARFLAERGLLRNPEYDVPVSLEDCRELAEAEGLSDPWVIAERYAASMLPAVFRIDDPVLSLELDPVHTQKLHRLVTELDAEVFQAEDSLGWTYQFWRAAEKKAVNDSGVKIGAEELPAVTQLFTEPYMVRFLLHNTLGAWWAGKVLAADPTLAQTAADEDALRAACSLPDYSFDMLRFVREGEDGPWRPAAGTFHGWPKEAKAITMLDPCCGSGHFLTEALAILAALRQTEEHLSPPDAVSAVLRDNLHGLEIDGRCVQIAAFAVALSAWRIGGWQKLPLPHVAWVGAPPPLQKQEFIALGEDDTSLQYALGAFYDLFSEAPIYGSLLEPKTTDLFEREKLRELGNQFDQLMKRTKPFDATMSEGMISARGMLDATSMLLRNFVLVATNVPFLGRINQSEELKRILSERYPESGFDLATAFIERSLNLTRDGFGAVASVMPLNWQYQTRYKAFRMRILDKRQISVCIELGKNAFQQPIGVNAGLAIFESRPERTDEITFITTDNESSAESKAQELRRLVPTRSDLNEILKISDCPIAPHVSVAGRFLSDVAKSYQGMMTGDGERFFLRFWEVANNESKWDFAQGANNSPHAFAGFTSIVRWEKGQGQLHAYAKENRHKLHDMHESGNRAWGKVGILINQQGDLKATPYYGAKIDGSASVIIPKEAEAIHAIWRYVGSKKYHDDVRKIDKKRNVTNANLIKVPRSSWTTNACSPAASMPRSNSATTPASHRRRAAGRSKS